MQDWSSVAGDQDGDGTAYCLTPEAAAALA
jgi:hypothetical protein